MYASACAPMSFSAPTAPSCRTSAHTPPSSPGRTPEHRAPSLRPASFFCPGNSAKYSRLPPTPSLAPRWRVPLPWSSGTRPPSPRCPSVSRSSSEEAGAILGAPPSHSTKSSEPDSHPRSPRSSPSKPFSARNPHTVCLPDLPRSTVRQTTNPPTLSPSRTRASG